MAGVFCLSLFAIPGLAKLLPSQEAENPYQTQLTIKLASGTEEQRLEAAIELGSFLSSEKAITSKTIAALEGVLRQDPSALVRALAARAMELSRDSRFIPVLLSSLKTEGEVEVSRAIIQALAVHHSSEIVIALLPLLSHKKLDIRSVASYALAEIGDPVSTEALISVLKNRGKGEDAFMRAQAARGLGRIGNREAIDILLVALNKDESSEVRRESVRSLGQIAISSDVKVIEALRQVRQQSDPYLQALATSALERIKL